MRLSIELPEKFAQGPKEFAQGPEKFAQGPKEFAQGVAAPGFASSAAGPRASLRRCRLGVAGWVVWSVASTLQPAPQGATAAPPAPHHHATATQHHAPQHHASGALAASRYDSLPYGGSFVGSGTVAGAKHSCGCGSCGKKRKSIARRLLDGVTAGTDRLIFGSSYPGGGDCDAGCDTACDAIGNAIGSMSDPAGGVHSYAPQPVGPAIDLLPAPVHNPPLPPNATEATPGAPGSAPAASSRKHPTSNIQRDQLRDPFTDDPVYQGANPAISRSAYYE